MIGAVLSCITGYMLSLSGEYDEELAGRHQWLGIFTAVVTLGLYIAHRFSIQTKMAALISAVLIVLVSITGHLGGSLTHGTGYLVEGLNSEDEGELIMKPIPNIQEAVLYTDVVQPLLQSKCYTCHGLNKQKGKLRLDQQQFILKGGKEGKVLEPGKADESTMIERMMLPLTDEDHMPPKEKKQLTPAQISLLHWWIKTGASFTGKVKDLQQPDNIKPILLALQSGTTTAEKKLMDVPERPVDRGDEAIISRLKKAGVVVIPVAVNSNYLSVSFFTIGAGADSLVKMLEPLKKQLVWLKLDDAAISDAALETISKLTELTRLQLANTGITDKGLTKLQSLEKLQLLNLVGTKVTAMAISRLNTLKALKYLYLYQTGVNDNELPQLQKIFPAATIDLGKYTVPTLETDTTEVKQH